MKKINVTYENCIGCGACVAIDPKHFDFDEDGRSQVINNEELETSELQNAIESCPTSAINMMEAEEETIEKDSCECECAGKETCQCHEEECDCEDCNCTKEHNCGCHCYQENEEKAA